MASSEACHSTCFLLCCSLWMFDTCPYLYKNNICELFFFPKQTSNPALFHSRKNLQPCIKNLRKAMCSQRLLSDSCVSKGTGLSDMQVFGGSLQLGLSGFVRSLNPTKTNWRLMAFTAAPSCGTCRCLQWTAAASKKGVKGVQGIQQLKAWGAAVPEKGWPWKFEQHGEGWQNLFTWTRTSIISMAP